MNDQIKKLFFIILALPIICIASLENVKNMAQVSPGVWDINCSNDKIERAVTDKILNNNVCANVSEQSKCVMEAKSLLPGNQVDDREEVAELVNACGVSDLEIDTCLREEKGKQLSDLSYNERKEVVQMISKCTSM